MEAKINCENLRSGRDHFARESAKSTVKRVCVCVCVCVRGVGVGGRVGGGDVVSHLLID